MSNKFSINDFYERHHVTSIERPILLEEEPLGSDVVVFHRLEDGHKVAAVYSPDLGDRGRLAAAEAVVHRARQFYAIGE